MIEYTNSFDIAYKFIFQKIYHIKQYSILIKICLSKYMLFFYNLYFY